MDCSEAISVLKNKFPGFVALDCSQDYPDEIRLKVDPLIFKDTALALHKIFSSPVMMLFALDERRERGAFVVNGVFASFRSSQWITVSMDIPQDNPGFETLAKSMHSASLFEREMLEMFGIDPRGNPDLRRLNLHDEVWPQGNFPLRKDFREAQPGKTGEYKFGRVEGEGIFEVPVGPVHAGIIGPGHFRFSVAGEPIINLEARLGFTHRGVEKLFEGKSYPEAIRLSECICGDSVFSHSLAFTLAAEKISVIPVTAQTSYLRAIFLELERIYNHVSDIGGIALDVGFSYPSAFASIIKEAILQLNEKLTGSRYLKSINTLGGVSVEIDENKKALLLVSLQQIRKDFNELVKILYASVSFMDRVDTTGVLIKKTAEDLGVIGLSGRASAIAIDLRKQFPGVYREAKFKMALEESGDVLARLKVRIFEFIESCRLLEEFAGKLVRSEKIKVDPVLKEGCGLGYAEGWRGPILCWLKTDPSGKIDRCKIVDPSFRNWQGLTYAVLGNIIPDFPLCNKSFDLSYSGNDL